ncbi:alpha/beta hydrolase [Actinacidiphila alni]|uniref:alpha/beta hydrolase n=1 Tax=Actinacidiphila alni TaxID=380248 RepID=UPI003F504161
MLTADGIAIEAEHRLSDAEIVSEHGGRRDGTEGAGSAGAGAYRERESAIVVAHGFTGALERPAVRRAARVLAGYGGVVTFSFRGHGRSGGLSTVGDLEVLDLDAAVAWARRLGYRRVVTVGFSMGGSVVLRHAAGTTVHAAVRSAERASARASTLTAADGVRPAREGRTTAHSPAHVDAVVSVSSPARWYYRGTAPMRRVHWAITRPAGRLVSRYGLKTRIRPSDWDPVPLSPVEAVPLIAPTPLLIVHGDQDGYFPLDHPLSLAAAAGADGDSAAELWIEPGFGHAENAARDALLRRIGDWLTSGVPAR